MSKSNRSINNVMAVRPIKTVTDINGDTLIAGNLYKIPLLNGVKGRTVRARVLREQQNVPDTYFRLYYIDETLYVKLVVIQKSVDSPGCANYPSKIEPLEA